MSESVLIVGGSGFIGKNLAIQSVRSGYKTTVLSLNEVSDQNKIPGIHYCNADLSEIDNLKKILSDMQFHYVVNLAGYIDHSRFLDRDNNLLNTHFLGLINLLHSLNIDKLKRFIQIGSSDEYGLQCAPQNENMRESPISTYSAAKVAATHFLQMLYKTESFPVVILRLFLVYGPGQDDKRFLPQVIKGCLSDKIFPTSAGEQLRDFTYIDDICRGILLALTSDDVCGEVINLASGKPISIRDVIRLVQTKISKGSPIFGEIPYRSSENMELFADTEKSKQLLNWEPEVDIYAGLDNTIEYYSCYGAS